MKKNFPRKIRPGSTKRAETLLEAFCRREILSALLSPRPPVHSSSVLITGIGREKLNAVSRSKVETPPFENSLHPRASLKSVVKTQRHLPIENRKSKFENNLHLLALSCTYLQLLAPNCSSHFPRSFLRLRNSDGGATSQLTRQTTNSTSAHRQFNISPHQLNSAEPHLHPATPNYTQLHQTTPSYTKLHPATPKKFFPSELKLKPNSPSVPCSFFIGVNP